MCWLSVACVVLCVGGGMWVGESVVEIGKLGLCGGKVV